LATLNSSNQAREQAMRILIHLGLNKCASTYVQQALAEAQAPLRRAGVFYPVEGGRAAQYGLSRHYGFGPDVTGVTPRSLTWMMAEAGRRGCDRMILSSEYLSLYRPSAIASFAAELQVLRTNAQFLFFSREIGAWVRSLFNQYVKTVDSGPRFRSINDFVDHVLANGAIDIAQRFGAWSAAVGSDRISHHYIATSQAPDRVLSPFAAFAGIAIAPAAGNDANSSLSPGALFLTGLLRETPPVPGRDVVLARIARRACSWVPVPDDFLSIDPIRMAKIEARISRPFATLPRVPLPSRAA
jgi:hypothetical protein